ncbi:AsmA-like C-terminal region-containing protein, partial [Bacteroidota bacterium]
FFTKKTEFKSFLSLVPAVYAKDFEDIETKGKLALNGLIKGIYNEVLFPTLNLDIIVEDAMFKYPDLPKSVDNIAINTNVSNPGGSIDKMIINIKQFHVEMAGNPVDIKMLITTSEEDVSLDGNIKGKLDLGQVQDFYPLAEGEDLSGIFKSDLSAKGNLSSLENEKYSEFEADGSLNITAMNYKSEDVPQGVSIKKMDLKFSPRYLEMLSFESTFGKSDIAASGRIDNILSYMFNDETLSGTFKLESNYMNLNEFIEEGEEEDVQTEEPVSDTSSAMTVFEVPDNIDFTLTTTIGKLIYDNMEMISVYGKVIIKDAAVILEDLNMNMLDGKLQVNGSYDTKDADVPMVDFGLDITNFDIQKSYQTFASFEKLAPIAKNTYGKFSTKMKLITQLDNEMMPVYNSMNGGGLMTTSAIQIKGTKMLTKLSEELKMDKLKELNMDKAMFEFTFVDGRVNVEPFDVNIGNIKTNISGSNGFDQTIDYTMKFQIPKSDFGGAANSVLNNLVSQANSQGTNFTLGETVNVDALIGGTTTDPTVKIGMEGTTMTSVVDDVKEKVKEKVDEVIDNAKEEAIKQAKLKAAQLNTEAEKRAKQIEDEAAKQAKKIRDGGKTAADQARNVSETAAQKIENEAKSKPKPLRKVAQKLADKERQKGEEKAKQLENEANKKAD